MRKKYHNGINGIEIDDLKKSLNIQGKNIVADEKKYHNVSNGIEIDDLKKSLNIQGKNIVFDREKTYSFLIQAQRLRINIQIY